MASLDGARLRLRETASPARTTPMLSWAPGARLTMGDQGRALPGEQEAAPHCRSAGEKSDGDDAGAASFNRNMRGAIRVFKANKAEIHAPRGVHHLLFRWTPVIIGQRLCRRNASRHSVTFDEFLKYRSGKPPGDSALKFRIGKPNSSRAFFDAN